MQNSLEPKKSNDLAPLYRNLVEHFGLGDLKGIAFTLNVDFENLSDVGGSKSGKAGALILALSRQNRLPELIDIVVRERPFITREELVSDIQFQTWNEALEYLFNEEELKTIATIDLGIDYERLPAEDKKGKARQLFLKLSNENRLFELIDIVERERPYVEAKDIVEGIQFQTWNEALEYLFNEEELKTITSIDLGIDHENFSGEGKKGLARELYLRVHRENRLPELIDIIVRERPFVESREIISSIHFETWNEALAVLFDVEELKTVSTISFGIDYESLPGEGKAAKAYSLVCELKRRKQLPALFEWCQKERPNYDNWDQLTVDCPRFSRQQKRIITVTLIVATAALLFWILWPPPLPRGFNVVVAEFGAIDENGRVQRSDVGREISRGLFEALDKEIEQLPTTLRAHIRGPGAVGIIEGAEREARTIEAAKIAERHNATILVYGVISNTNTFPQIELEFFVSEKGFGYGSEVAGPDRLGRPILLNPQTVPGESIEQKEELKARTEAMQKLVEGLANYYIGHYEEAYANFKWAATIPGWLEEDGKEVIYLLMGAARLQTYNLEGEPHQLESARSDFIKAREANNEYARSYLGLGAVVLGNIDTLTDTNVITLELTKAEGLYLTALIMPDQPELAYIPIKAANGLGEVYLRARQNRVANWPGQITEDELSCKLQEDEDYVVEVGKCAFEQVLIQYEAKGEPTDLQWLVAHAHAKLGILAGYSEDWSIMVEESRLAIQMLEELPDDVVFVNQIWIARYWGQLGFAYDKLEQTDNAHFAYEEAIRIGGTTHIDSEEITRWEEAKSRLEENSQ